MKSISYLIILIALTISSCSINQEIKAKVVVLKDSIQNPYTFINEIKVISKNKKISEKTNKSVQLLSENKKI